MSELKHSSFLGKALLASVFVSAIFGAASASAYTVTFDAQGARFSNGTGINAVTYDNGTVTGDEYELPNLGTPDVYEMYWSTDLEGKERIDVADLTEDTTVYAQYRKVQWKYGYTGDVQSFTVPYERRILYELWGAQGGDFSNNGTFYHGGAGGYSRGYLTQNYNDVLYIVNGQKGMTGIGYSYNGGGPSTHETAGSGGGATHIALETGILSEFKEKQDKVVMVAGAGGGMNNSNGSLTSISGRNSAGGGYLGNEGIGAYRGRGGSQTTPGPKAYGNVGALRRASDFGLGGGAENNSGGNQGGGGGAGWYGGSGGGWGVGGSGGGGSGYVGYQDLYLAKMYGLRVTESTTDGEITISTANYSEEPVSRYAKLGDGYTLVSINKARIDFRWGDNEDFKMRYWGDTVDADGIDTTRAGYEFTGWYLDDEPFDFSTPIEGDITLVAHYTLATYNIAYNLYNGSVATENPTTYTIESGPFTLNNPTKDYYTFTGWSGTGLTGNENTSVTIPTGSYGDREYTAHYAPIDYNISYDLDGGTNNANNPTTYNYESNAITLADPTKEGYSFKGWIENDGDTPGSITIPTNSHDDRSFKAVFEINEYTASFNANGGSTASPETITKNYGASLGELPTTSRTGYKFDGWFTGQNDGDEISASTTMPATNPTYYAHWTPIQYTFKFDANTAEGSMTDLVYEYDEEKPLTTMSFTKLGYTFTGWNTDTDGNGDSFTDGQNIKNLTTVDGTIYTLYAQWSRDTYTIDYDLTDGETSETLVTSYNVESDDITLPTPTRKGYKFLGWSGTDIADKAEDVTITTGSTGNRSYTANWEIINYTITYDMDGHINNASNPGGYTVTSPDITLATPTAKDDYYYFVGWTLDRDTEDGLTKDFVIPTGSTGDITVYAIFQQNPYTVTFDSDGAGDYPERVLRGDAMIGALPTPEKAGYKFLGWFVDGEQIDENFHSRYDVTAVAHWEEEPMVPNTGANGSPNTGDAIQSYIMTFACCLLGILIALKLRPKAIREQ